MKVIDRMVLAIIVGLEVDGGKVRDGEKRYRLIKHHGFVRVQQMNKCPRKNRHGLKMKARSSRSEARASKARLLNTPVT